MARLLEASVGPERAWTLGFVPYWLGWCVAIPWLLIRPRGVARTVGPAAMTPLAWLVVSLPPLLALAGRLFAAPEAAGTPLVIPVVNGALEELLWRGVFVTLFPRSVTWGVIWPTAWFALWHLAPGSLVMGADVWLLVLGAAVFGGCMGWVAQRSGSIRWTVVSHILAGLVQA